MYALAVASRAPAQAWAGGIVAYASHRMGVALPYRTVRDALVILANAGLVRCTGPQGKQGRLLYRVTPKGRKRLQTMRSELHTLAATV